MIFIGVSVKIEKQIEHTENQHEFSIWFLEWSSLSGTHNRHHTDNSLSAQRFQCTHSKQFKYACGLCQIGLKRTNVYICSESCWLDRTICWQFINHMHLVDVWLKVPLTFVVLSHLMNWFISEIIRILHVNVRNEIDEYQSTLIW